MLDIALWSGCGNPTLATAIAKALGLSLYPMALQSFPDSESHIQIPKSFKARTLYIIQSLCAPVNHHLMELLLMCDAAHQTDCTHLNLVIPYLAYARQDKGDTDFYTPLAAKLVADLLAMCKPLRIITMDVHSDAAAHFFSTSLEVLSSTSLFAEAIHHDLAAYAIETTPLIVSPDRGSRKRAQSLATALETDFIILDKKAQDLHIIDASLESVHMHNRPCILVDDMVDSGKTVCNAASFLKQHGANAVLAYATHAVLSKDALAHLLDSVDQLTLTDTLPLSQESQNYLETQPTLAKKLCILSAANCFAKAINPYEGYVPPGNLSMRRHTTYDKIL